MFKISVDGNKIRVLTPLCNKGEGNSEGWCIFWLVLHPQLWGTYCMLEN